MRHYKGNDFVLLNYDVAGELTSLNMVMNGLGNISQVKKSEVPKANSQ